MKTVGFNLKKALQVIGINDEKIENIIYDEQKAYFATELIFRAFSSFNIMLIMLDKDNENLTEEEAETLHNDRLVKCFPGVFYVPTAEEAAATARKFERLKVIEEIMEQQES